MEITKRLTSTGGKNYYDVRVKVSKDEFETVGIIKSSKVSVIYHRRLH